MGCCSRDDGKGHGLIAKWLIIFQNTKMIRIITFIQFVIDLLKKYPPAPGKLIMIEKTMLPNSGAIGNMKLYICDALRNALLSYGYYLIDRLCTSQYLVVLDVHVGIKNQLNFYSKVLYRYDEATGNIIEREFDETPIDSDFSLTSEELDDILSKF